MTYTTSHSFKKNYFYGNVCVNMLPTFESRLQNRSRFGSHQDPTSVFAQGSALLVWDNQLTNEPCSVSDVIVLIVLAQVQYVLSQQFCLYTRKKDKTHSQNTQSHTIKV